MSKNNSPRKGSYNSWLLSLEANTFALDHVLRSHAEVMPIQYARELKPRVFKLLLSDRLPDSIRRQLLAVKGCLLNRELAVVYGLDNLHNCLDTWEQRYA